MTLDPILNAPLVIQLHILSALPALFLGPFALFRSRRDTWHKVLGYSWVLCMISVAVTGLMIPSDIAIVAWFGPIHLFSVFTLWGVAEGLYYIKRGNIQKHIASMQSVWFGAMALASLFTFLPGRRLNRSIFGEPSNWGYVIIAVGLVGVYVLWRDRRKTIRMA